MFRPRRLARVWVVAALIALLILPAVALSAPAGRVPARQVARDLVAAPGSDAVAATDVDAATGVDAKTDVDASPTSPAGEAVAETQQPATTDAAPATAITATGIVPGSVNRTSLNLTATYTVGLRLNFGTRSFRADTTIDIVNTSGGPIDRLELNTIAARLGGMHLTAMTVDGTPVTATIDDQTIIVPLGGVLDAGATTRVRVSYGATLRSTLFGSNWLFTRTNGVLEAYRWIPWVSRRTPFNRPNHGDPFVTPVSPRVRVAITSDRTLVYATPGSRIAVSGLRQTFEATNVRDFAFTAAPDYRTISATVGDNVIRVYYRGSFPALATLAAAKRAITRMEALVGPYPYRTYRLAQSAGGYGMESPGLTWIPSGVARTNLAYLVTHETGHQWFYSLIGNDQARQPFADEAATDFLARYTLSLRRASRCSTARLDLTIYRYSGACYYEIVYIQGGNFIDDLRRRMGSTAFWRGIRAYVAANRFQFGSTKELLDTLDAATTLNLVPRYTPRFPSIY
jgi:hypothetical protein